MVEHFNSMRVGAVDEIPANAGEVPCDLCAGPKLKAQKTCLGCLASYCQPHLEQHQRVPTFKKHLLVDPVSNLENQICKKHNKMFELFCHADQMCVCFMCLKDEHAAHEAVPIEDAFRERKAWLVLKTSEIKLMENTKSIVIRDIKCSTKQSRKDSEKEIRNIAEVFTALVVSLQRSQAKLVGLIQEKQKAAERQAEDRVTQLEQEVAELRRRRSEMEQLLQTEGQVCLLQSSTSLYSPANTGDQFEPLSHPTQPSMGNLCDISRQSYVGIVKKAVTQMEKMLGNEMEMLIHEIRLSDGCPAAPQPDAVEKLTRDEFIKEMWNPPLDKLMMIQQCDAVDVTLDSYTAHSTLQVSEDGKQLKFYGGRHLFKTLFGRRFTYNFFVLGKEGFSSGRFYYEVLVSGTKSFVLGVTKESINREMFGFPTPEDGAWTLVKVTNHLQEEYYGNFHDPPLSLKQNPQRVGVFVDYERGEVSFYDVDARTLIYSYTGLTFNESTPALKAFLYSMAGSVLSNRPKLYPVFGIFGIDSNDTLTITPVAI